MDNQIIQPSILAQRIILIIVLCILIIGVTILGIYWHRVSDPYVQEVLSLPGDVTKGIAIFQINRAGFHGLGADINVGPSLQDIPRRKSKVGIIYQVISGKTPPMPKFQPNSQEMADLLTYLEQL